MFIAGSNMPGFMPDREPAEFETFDDAKRHVISLVKDSEDCADTEDDAEELSAFAEDVNLQSKEFRGTCCGLAYWVTTD